MTSSLLVTHPSTLQVEYTTTADNVVLALGRYANFGGPPVILMHGFAQNYRTWDLPMAGHSLALYLARRGYDVWLPNFRSHGRGTIKSEPCHDRPWNVDDLALYDVPAIIAKVEQETTSKPVWIGHSMGGMVAYMYLQGIQSQETKVGEQVVSLAGEQFLMDSHGHRIHTDHGLARSRQQQLRGLVTIATPTRMCWRYDPAPWQVGQYSFWDYSLLLSLLTRFKKTRQKVAHTDFIPLGSLLTSLLVTRKEESFFRSCCRHSLKLTLSMIASSHVLSLIWYPPNMTRELVEIILQETVDDIPAHILLQFADWIENKTFREYHTADSHRRPYIYSDHYHLLQIPTLVIAGDRDKIACADIIYEGYSQIASADKVYHCFPLFGHNDLINGLGVCQKVFPFIESWVRERVAW